MSNRSTSLALSLASLTLLLAGCPAGPAPADGGGAADTPTAIGCDTACDDGLFCNGEERCEAGRCVSGEPPDCDDGMECTTDACSEERLRCENVAPDADGDGYGSAACLDAMGDPVGNDCDDTSPGRYPGNREICDDASVDEDCDGTTFGERDGDDDGANDATCCNGGACGDDCNDSSRAIGPDVAEVCNRIDDDCDGNVDETGDVAGFVDGDFDGRGDSLRPMRGCAGSVGFSVYGDDCNDANVEIRTGQAEFCDMQDNDCDGTVDEETAPILWYPDVDGDGFGDPRGTATMSCARVPGRSILGTDCADGNAARSPRAPEICNGVDDDCSGSADFLVGPGDREDDDGDGFADIACAGGTDCNDLDRTVAGGSQEICNGRDDDCDGVRDDACVECTTDAHCGGGGLCIGNVCQMICGADGMCAPGQTCCTGACVDTMANAANCGGCGNRCVLFQAFPACAGGECTVGACSAPYADCDGVADNGCEIDTTRSVLHCGGCGRTCTVPHATPTCDMRACRIATCEFGWRDCDGVPENGCEVDTLGDEANCGACDASCAPTRGATAEECVTGTCRISTCETGRYDCNGSAVDGCELALPPPRTGCVNVLRPSAGAAYPIVTSPTGPTAALTDDRLCGGPFDFSGAATNIYVDLGPGTHAIERATMYLYGQVSTGTLYGSADGTSYTVIHGWDSPTSVGIHDFAVPSDLRYFIFQPNTAYYYPWQVMEVQLWECP